MKRLLLLILAGAGLVTGLNLALTAAAADEPTREQAAQAAAEHWLALLDGGQYAGSWQEAAASFKKAVNQKKWKQSMQPIRDPLGKVGARKLKAAEYTNDLPGAPEGEYVRVQFETEFANRKSAVETVTTVKEKDDRWRVSAYVVR